MTTDKPEFPMQSPEIKPMSDWNKSHPLLDIRYIEIDGILALEIVKTDYHNLLLDVEIILVP